MPIVFYIAYMQAFTASSCGGTIFIINEFQFATLYVKGWMILRNTYTKRHELEKFPI